MQRVVVGTQLGNRSISQIHVIHDLQMVIVLCGGVVSILAFDNLAKIDSINRQGVSEFCCAEGSHFHGILMYHTCTDVC